MVHAQVFAVAQASQFVRRAAPYVLAVLLSLGLLATAGGGAASANMRKPHMTELAVVALAPSIALPGAMD